MDFISVSFSIVRILGLPLEDKIDISSSLGNISIGVYLELDYLP